MTVGSLFELLCRKDHGTSRIYYSTPEVFVRFGYIMVEDSWWRTGLVMVAGNS